MTSSPPLYREQISLRFRLDELYLLFGCFDRRFLLCFTRVLQLIHANTQKKTRQKQANNKRTTKNLRTKTKNTGHPAHHSTANKYLLGSRQMSCICCCLLYFSKVICVLFVFTKVCSLIHANTQKDQAKTKTTKIQDILQPTTRPRINISQVPAGCTVFVFFVFLDVFLLFFCFLLFLHSLFEFLHV